MAQSGANGYFTHTINSTYVLNGSDNSDPSKSCSWIFITPVKNWNTVKIGYKITSVNGEPKYPAIHYQHYTATPVSKVTAIVH